MARLPSCDRPAQTYGIGGRPIRYSEKFGRGDGSFLLRYLHGSEFANIGRLRRRGRNFPGRYSEIFGRMFLG